MTPTDLTLEERREAGKDKSTGSLTDWVQITFEINAAKSRRPAIVVLVGEVRAHPRH